MRFLEFYQDCEAQAKLFAQHRSKAEQIPELVRRTAGSRDVVLTGIATSLSAWKSVHCLLGTQMPAPPVLLNTSDLLDYSFPAAEDERPLFVLSRSGNSAEIARLMKEISASRKVIAMTEGCDSVLAKRATELLDFSADERAFPNTSSFTLSQLYALCAAIGLGYQPSRTLTELLDVLSAESETFCAADMPNLPGSLLADAQAVLVEGQGYLTGVAEQYALDFHETRTPGIAVVGGIMRHGVVELTERSGVVTVMLIPDDRAAGRKLKLARELDDAGKPVIVVTDTDAAAFGRGFLRVPNVPVELKSIFFTLGMQKLYGSYIESGRISSIAPALVGKVTRME